MRFPKICGLIDRRILCNYRIDPEYVEKILPAPFRPQIKNGYAIGGICLIRLRQIRPHFLPPHFGVNSENAAHRFAVEWDTDQGKQHGVYIPRRDTSSRLNAFVGGRLFPGVHHHAHFDISEEGNSYSIQMDSNEAHVLVKGSVTPEIPKDSIFDSVQTASHFFKRDSLGYSDSRENGLYDGLELDIDEWAVQAMHIQDIESSYFNDKELFPEGSIQFDHALLMLNLQHKWIGRHSIISKPKTIDASSFALNSRK